MGKTVTYSSIYTPDSVRFTIRLPRHLHDQLSAEAARQGRTLSAHITYLLNQITDAANDQTPVPQYDTT